MKRIETMHQPNGADIRISVMPESFRYGIKNGTKNSFKAFIYVTYDYGSMHTPYTLVKTLYYDDKGIYTYLSQKTPIYYWKVTNIETEYEHWSKTEKGYAIALNEPRILKRNYF